MKSKNQLLKILIGLISIAMVLSACSPASTPDYTGVELPTEATTVDEEPVTFRVAVEDIWDTPNPATGWENWTLRSLIFDTISEWTTSDGFEPGLAESWEVSDDGLVWTFKIREGVTFHDGTPCDAEAVAWSVNFYIDNEIETMGSYVWGFEDVRALDSTTMQITLAEPTAVMISSRLMYLWIVPKSVWEGKTREDILEFDDIVSATGSGPYKVVDYVKDEYLILEANEDYWRGAPKIDKVVYQQFATSNAMVQALLGGDVDMVHEAPPTALKELEEHDNVEIVFVQSMSVNNLIINSKEDGTQHPALWDPAVRLAIAYGIDKQKVANVAYAGYAEPQTAFLAAGMGNMVNTDIVEIPFDPAEGNRVLEEAGYLDTDGDGVREDADGNPLEFRLYSEDSGTTVRTIEIISEGLALIGISAPPIPQDDLGVYYPSYDFDLMYWGWYWDPDPDFAVSTFTCEQAKDGGFSDCGLYAAQASEMDPEKRREVIWDAQELVFNERPYIMVVEDPGIDVYNNDRFTGFGTESKSILWKYAFLMGKPVQ